MNCIASSRLACTVNHTETLSLIVILIATIVLGLEGNLYFPF